MKNLCPLGLLTACFFVFQSLSAQQPVTIYKSGQPGISKHALAKLPQKLDCSLTALKKISIAKLQENIAFQFGDVQFAGQVIDKVQRSANMLNMNIRLTNYSDALFTLSVITTEDNKQKLVGRIIDPNSDDVLVLTEENNRYFFEKQPKEFFITE
jgi:hypothetical protein